MSKKKVTVYKVELNGKIIYIGLTNNLKRRTYQHQYALGRPQTKELYRYIQEHYPDFKFVLTPIESFTTRTEAKRYEMYLILQDYFGKKELKQTPPGIR